MKKSRLTPAFVNALQPPEYGETWVADTVVKGFGVRLWATQRGSGKAYIIRVKDKTGHYKREAYSPYQRWGAAVIGYDKFSNDFGSFLEDARNWARDRIDHFKGHPTLLEEEKIQSDRVRGRIKRLTLGQVAESMINGMRVNSLSSTYVDRLDKLFHNYVPSKTKKIKLSEVKTQDLMDVFLNENLSYENARILRGFLGKINKNTLYSIKGYDEFLDNYRVFMYNDNASELIDVRLLELVIGYLKDDREKWRQSMALYMYLISGSSALNILTLRYDQFDGRFWCTKSNRNNYYNELRISEAMRRGINIICERHREFGIESPYFFPSRKSLLDHIKTFSYYISGLIAEGLLPSGTTAKGLQLAYKPIRVRESWAELYRNLEFTT